MIPEREVYDRLERINDQTVGNPRDRWHVVRMNITTFALFDTCTDMFTSNERVSKEFERKSRNGSEDDTVPEHLDRLLYFKAGDTRITFENVVEVGENTGPTYIDAKVLPTKTVWLLLFATWLIRLMDYS